MAISPELLPGPSGPQADPFNYEPPLGGLNLGAPEAFPGDLYPTDENRYAEVLSWCNSAFQAAESAKKAQEERWRRYYRLYRSHIVRRAGDWRSSVFVPMVFNIVETVTPRLVAQLPKFVCQPVGPEDQLAAKKMEILLDHAVKESGLYEELVKAFKSSLKYGTGILKTFYREDKRRARKMMPQMAPIIQQVPEPLMDPDDPTQPLRDLDTGEPIVEVREVNFGEMPVGQSAQVYSYTAYQGPAAKCIDIFDFYVAPEAEDIDSARYVIHRSFQKMSYVLNRVKEGVYHWPENMDEADFTNTQDNPALSRLSDIDLGGGSNDPTRKEVELLEFWTDDGRVITMANRKAILRVQTNPFDHSEKPFVRIVDYLQEHEFWGVGEIEPIEGLQDARNAVVNSRLDNLRLVLNAMFAVDIDMIEDMRDLRSRPGGVIRLKPGGIAVRDVLERVDYGDVTASAFQEDQALGEVAKEVTGVGSYAMGLDSPSMNDTATGAAMIIEQGASRFGLKSKLIELMGLVKLGRQFGSIIQQFTTEERKIRLTGQDGALVFQEFGPESIQGALDIDIQSESTTQTKTVRMEQKMNLLALLAQYSPGGVPAVLEDILELESIKDKGRYLKQEQPQQMAPEQGLNGIPPTSPDEMDLPPAEYPGQVQGDQMFNQIASDFDQQAQQ